MLENELMNIDMKLEDYEIVYRHFSKFVISNILSLIIQNQINNNVRNQYHKFMQWDTKHIIIYYLCGCVIYFPDYNFLRKYKGKTYFL